jgi:DNA-binding transcriptional ArsR family regulator
MAGKIKARKNVRQSRKPAAAPVPALRAILDPANHWTFLSNHGHVLVCLARNPDARVRDVAAAVGITERAVQNILGDLEDGGVLTRERIGRRNHYELHFDIPLRHQLEAHRTVGSLLRMVLTPPELKALGL